MGQWRRRLTPRSQAAAARSRDAERGVSGLAFLARPEVHWRDPSVVAAAAMALLAGVGQFGVVASLGDVARSFGHIGPGPSLAERAGLTGTQLGLGLAVIRLASLGGLPLAGLADRLGRRRTTLVCTTAGLALSALAALAPSFWSFVALFALGRPALSATSALAQVVAAELTSSRERAKAVALVAAGYAVGTGSVAVLHGLVGGLIGFRGLLGLALVALAFVPVVGRRLVEPARFERHVAAGVPELPVLGAVGRRFRGRLGIVVVIAAAVSVVSGPANSFVYLYAENVRRMPGPIVSAMVVAAGLVGLGGLLAGRRLADRLGRRPTAAVALVGIAAFGILAYSGSSTALLVGYEAGVLAGACFAPAAGALANELFPTSVRASVAGWQVAAGVVGASAGLVAFGAVADVGNRFGLGALVTFAPAALAALGFLALPETKGVEPEQLWGEEQPRATAVGDGRASHATWLGRQDP
jgi:MFS family permease